MQTKKSEHRIVAMWSGPRNISTAMMRAWENRPDAVVLDEPLYGHYLHITGLPHPGATEVIADQGADWQSAVEKILAPLPPGKRIHYQKHMTHHLLPDIRLGWFEQVEHCFLIRDPREVLASYLQKRVEVRLDDIGFRQQAEIFDRVTHNRAATPPIIDAKDVLTAPEALLTRLCQRLGIPFHENMLSWPAGPRESDGVWARHWYDSVYRSTGFMPYTRKEIELSPDLEQIADAAKPYYEKLYALRLQLD